MLASSLSQFQPRACPGNHLAEASIWIVVATVLAAFEIVPKTDADGVYVAPEITFTSAVTR